MEKRPRKGGREQNKRQKAGRPFKKEGFLSTRHGIYANHMLVTAWQGVEGRPGIGPDRPQRYDSHE